MAQPITACDNKQCKKPSRMALQVFNTNGVMFMKVWFDERQKTAKATAYCKQHGLAVMRELADTVVNLDEGE